MFENKLLDLFIFFKSSNKKKGLVWMYRLKLLFYNKNLIKVIFETLHEFLSFKFYVFIGYYM